jgi:hypothetical protein
MAQLIRTGAVALALAQIGCVAVSLYSVPTAVKVRVVDADGTAIAGAQVFPVHSLRLFDTDEIERVAYEEAGRSDDRGYALLYHDLSYCRAEFFPFSVFLSRPSMAFVPYDYLVEVSGREPVLGTSDPGKWAPRREIPEGQSAALLLPDVFVRSSGQRSPAAPTSGCS